MNNQGKQFEARFAQDWKRVFPEGFLLRLYDQTGGKVNVVTPCDYIGFNNKKLYMIECKSHDGASIPFTAISQYERLLRYKDIKDVHPGFIIWFKEKDIVLWVDINVAEKIYNDGNKSIQLKMFNEKKYDIVEIPSTKKRVFMESDYSILDTLYSD